jgi:U3 small nucleolar RNA-associated protein 7
LFVKHKADQEKVQSPYMAWGGEGKAVERVRWCPFEDTLGVSHDEGFSVSKTLLWSVMARPELG